MAKRKRQNPLYSPSGTPEENAARLSSAPIERIPRAGERVRIEIEPRPISGVVLSPPDKNGNVISFMAKNSVELDAEGIEEARKVLDKIWTFPLDRNTLITVIVLAYLSVAKDAKR